MGSRRGGMLACALVLLVLLSTAAACCLRVREYAGVCTETLEAPGDAPFRGSGVCDLGFAFAPGSCGYEPRCADFDYTRAVWDDWPSESATLLNPATFYHGTAPLTRLAE